MYTDMHILVYVFSLDFILHVSGLCGQIVHDFNIDVFFIFNCIPQKDCVVVPTNYLICLVVLLHIAFKLVATSQDDRQCMTMYTSAAK